MPRSQKNPHLSAVLDRNIRTLYELRRQMERKKSVQDRSADVITAFCGSMNFVYVHVAWFLGWILWNLGIFGLPPFDPFPFGLLTMLVSLEAIFLSTFVLISQNRMAAMSDDRSDLDLQINLLSEYEITKLLKIADAIADHLGLKEGNDQELPDLERIVKPEEVLRSMEAHKREYGLRTKG